MNGAHRNSWNKTCVCGTNIYIMVVSWSTSLDKLCWFGPLHCQKPHWISKPSSFPGFSISPGNGDEAVLFSVLNSCMRLWFGTIFTLCILFVLDLIFGFKASYCSFRIPLVLSCHILELKRFRFYWLNMWNSSLVCRRATIENLYCCIPNLPQIFVSFVDRMYLVYNHSVSQLVAFSSVGFWITGTCCIWRSSTERMRHQPKMAFPLRDSRVVGGAIRWWWWIW